MPVTISVGQALLIMIDHTRKISRDEKENSPNSLLLEELKGFYLSGVTEKTLQRLQALLEIGATKGWFKSFVISNDYRVIDEDPTRRYFETKLAYFTLEEALPGLASTNLVDHFRNLTKERVVKAARDEAFFAAPLDLGNLDEASLEFIHSCKRVNTPEGFPKLARQDKDKLVMLIKTAFFGCKFISHKQRQKVSLPLSIYSEGFFEEKNRGRIKSANDHTVASMHLGLMKSYMPVPLTGLWPILIVESGAVSHIIGALMPMELKLERQQGKVETLESNRYVRYRPSVV